MGTFVGNRTSALDETEDRVLGNGRDPIAEVEARCRAAYPGTRVIVWEGDAQTFQFTYVSPQAEQLLGYQRERWLCEPAFWAEEVVASEDRREAVAYCALATAAKRDHVFEYRAVSASGATLVLRDVVRVVLGPRGIPERLRGLMFDVSTERDVSRGHAELRFTQRPSRAELESN